MAMVSLLSSGKVMPYEISSTGRLISRVASVIGNGFKVADISMDEYTDWNSGAVTLRGIQATSSILLSSSPSRLRIFSIG